jgi:hypothetical protein
LTFGFFKIPCPDPRQRQASGKVARVSTSRQAILISLFLCALVTEVIAGDKPVVTVPDLESTGISRAEQQFSVSDCGDASCQVRIGELLSAELAGAAPSAGAAGGR